MMRLRAARDKGYVNLARGNHGSLGDPWKIVDPSTTIVTQQFPRYDISTSELYGALEQNFGVPGTQTIRCTPVDADDKARIMPAVIRQAITVAFIDTEYTQPRPGQKIQVTGEEAALLKNAALRAAVIAVQQQAANRRNIFVYVDGRLVHSPPGCPQPT